MFKNGVYIFEPPIKGALSAFIVYRYFDQVKIFNLYDSDDRFLMFMDLFGSTMVDILLNRIDLGNHLFIKTHFEFAMWLDRYYRPSYYEFVKLYYDSLKV